MQNKKICRRMHLLIFLFFCLAISHGSLIWAMLLTDKTVELVKPGESSLGGELDTELIFYASDILVLHGDIDTKPMIIRFLLDGMSKVWANTGTPIFVKGKVEWAMGSHSWAELRDLEGVKWDINGHISVKFPQIPPTSQIQFLVIRVSWCRTGSFDQKYINEFKMMVAVVPDSYVSISSPLEAVVFDIDDTLADDSDPEELIKYAAIKLKEYIRAGCLITYVTTRKEDVTRETRDWLLMHNLPPGLIFTAPAELNTRKPEERREFKEGVMKQIKRVASIIGSYGDSVIADALAGMNAGVALVHLFSYPLDDDSDPRHLESRIPPGYKEQRSGMFQHKGKMIRVHKYAWSDQVLTAVQLNRALPACRLESINPPPSQPNSTTPMDAVTNIHVVHSTFYPQLPGAGGAEINVESNAK